MPTQRWKTVHWSQRFDGEDLLCDAFYMHSFAETPGPSRQSVGLNGCVRQKTWRMRRHHELCPLSCIDRSQRSKSQNARKEERSYHDQSKSRTDSRGCSPPREKEDVVCPRCDPRTLCFQHNFGTDSALSWMDSCRSTVYADQSMPQWSHNPWRVAEYQPYRGWKLSEWFWWLRNTSKTRRWYPKSTSFKRLDSPGASFGCKPSLGTGTVRSVATSPSTVSAPSTSTADRGDVDDGSLAKCFPRKTDPLGTCGVWTRERIGLVCNRPVQH